MKQKQILIGPFFAFFVLSAWPALSQELKAVGQIRSSGPRTSVASEKIVSRLRALIADFQSLAITGANEAAQDAAGRFSSETLKVDGAGRVQIYVWVTDTSELALDTLRRHGLDVEVVNEDFGIVQGWIAAENIEALAAELVVVKVRPPSYATPRTGNVNSQGDSIHRCDQARSRGFNGAGVKVGVISDGVSGLATSQAAGELGFLQVLSSGSGDEGTAMLEIIADCAPGAALAFAGVGTSLEFVRAVNSLRDAGAQIIVDDLGFYGDPVFEDGTIALNDRAVGATVLRVSSAGNDGLRHYAGTFAAGMFDPEVSGTRHNFGGGDTLLRFRIPAGQVATIFLQWSNPFGAAGDDYDLCVRRTDGSLSICSRGVQDGNDDPIEAVSVNCMGLTGTFCVLDAQITLFSGSPQQLQLFCPRCAMFDEFNVRSGSIFGHAAVPEVLAVSASSASNPGAIESFSSAGPATILFPSAETRLKPDLNGIDGVMTSRPGFNPFFGTSAAAPHVAAVAAIVMQSRDVGATAQSVAAILKATATDLGPPGFDFNFGAGLVDALTAINPLISINNVVAKKGQNAVFTVTLLPASNQTITVDYSTQDGTAIAGADYIPQSNTLTFTAGQVAKTIIVAIPANDTAGPNKYFVVNLSNPKGANASISDAQGIGRIRNRNNVPMLPADFDADRKAEIAVYRDGTWWIVRSSDGVVISTLWGGAAQDILVPGDYDGDGKTDQGVYRDGMWWILRSSNGGGVGIMWGGAPQDIPVPGDYDGDGKTDQAVYRDGVWWILRSSNGGGVGITWGGAPQDIPVPGDYDGDGKTDTAVYRDGTWWILRSSDGVVISKLWGGAVQDIPVQGDYDGDRKTDTAVYRDGTWWIVRSSDGAVISKLWGGAVQDIPFNSFFW